MSAQLETSDDSVLDGGLILRQPLRGHRVGHDAILLAATTSGRAGEHAVDLGAGVGAAGLALARRVDELSVTLVEIDPALTGLADGNIARNRLSGRVRAVCLDVAAPAAAFAAAGLAAGWTDCVLMNPPFNALDNPSPQASRRTAHAAPQGALRQWVRTASRLLRPGGTLTLVWRADGIAEVLTALASAYGAVSLLPVYGKPGAPAIRILARAVKASRAPLSLLPGLLLADRNGKPTAQAEAILRGGAALPLPET
ncbi:MAG: tRNA1(Val) (adenine(37)-N6)-methyltransferase [Xanthobacteraceae bacterium]